MARIRCEIRFWLEEGIWVDFDCLGSRVTFDHEALNFEIAIPPFSQTDVPISFSNLQFEGFGGTARRDADGHGRCSINQILVVIRETSDAISRESLETESRQILAEVIAEYERKRIRDAEKLLIDFLDVQRGRGQVWLGPAGQVSYAEHPQATTFEEDSNHRFMAGFGLRLDVKPRPSKTALDKETFKEIVGRLATPEILLDLPEVFLADAGYFLQHGNSLITYLSSSIITLENRHFHDFQRAILHAAIACEIKVKLALRQKVFPQGLPLVEALISSPRDFSMSAAGLFDKAMRSAVGVSLKDSDRKLFNRIQALFEKRNKIAHSGTLVSQEEASECVAAAREVFAWLEDLPPSSNRELP